MTPEAAEHRDQLAAEIIVLTDYFKTRNYLDVDDAGCLLVATQIILHVDAQFDREIHDD